MKISLLIAASLISLNLIATEKLTIWTSKESVRDAILSVAAPFEKEFDTKLEVVVLNKDLTSQFKTAALSQKGPDILTWAHDVVGELAESGLIEPLTIPPQLEKSLLPVTLKAFTYKDRLFGYPYDLEAVALISNKNLLPKVPETFEELLAMQSRVPKDHYLFLYDIANFFFSFPLISSNGGYIFKDQDGALNVHDVGLANSGAVIGGTFIDQLVEKNIVPSSTDYGIAASKMTSGKLFATINGPWFLEELRKNNIPYQISPIPQINGKRPRPFVGTHGFMVRRSSSNKELAKELIEKYLLTKEGIIALYKADPRCPSRQDAIETLAATDPDLPYFMASAAEGIPMPNIPEMGVVWQAMGNALQLITTQKSTPEPALTQAVRQIEAAINKK